MSVLQHISTIFMCVIGTVFTRFLPFILFRSKKDSSEKQLPSYIIYLGRVLPAAIFGMIIVYCLKNTQIIEGTHGFPELIAIILTVALHLWKRQTLLSIAAGTVCYMLLVQHVFV